MRFVSGREVVGEVAGVGALEELREHLEAGNGWVDVWEGMGRDRLVNMAQVEEVRAERD